MNSDREMQRLAAECAAHFQKLYAPEGKVLVFGEGSASASVLLVGEAPGEQETLQRQPFVGRAGKNLDELLQLCGLRRADVYITNVVKIRPFRISDKGRVSNRPPNAEERMLFTPWLLREIEIVRPEVLVTLGNVPLHAVTGSRVPIGEVHGRFWPEPVRGARLFPLYHPASVIYNRALASAFREDILALRQHLFEKEATP